MRTATRLLPLLGLLAACSHQQSDPAPAPDPAPTYAYSSKFTNFDPTHADRTAAFTTAQVSATAATTATTLQLRLDANQQEAVLLEVPLAALGGQWTGAYALRCPQRPTDPVAATYLAFPKASTAVSAEYSSTYMQRPLSGSLIITAYDAGRHLLSGSFQLNTWQQLYPFDFPNYVSDMALAGEFANVKIKPQ